MHQYQLWYVFQYCYKIDDIAFGNADKIGNYAFFSCTGITNLIVGSIGQYAFRNCTGITEIHIPEKVNFCGEGVFYGCTGLTGTKTFPEHFTFVPAAYYSHCTGLQTLSINENITEIPEHFTIQCTWCYRRLCFLQMQRTRLIGLIVISDYSFYQCTKLKGGLNMSIFVDLVSSYAFYGCANLNGPLTFSSNLFEIGDYAFYGCSSLNGALHLGFGLRRVGAYAFYQCPKLTGLLRIGYRKFEKYSEYENGGYYYDYYTCRICDYAFYGCSKFTGDLLLFNVSYIGKFAFYRWGFTGSLTVPISIIDDYAFYGCSGFKGPLRFDDSNLWTELKYDYTIGKYAFSNCAGFNGTLIIPPEYQVIGDYAFCGGSGFNSYL